MQTGGQGWLEFQTFLLACFGIRGLGPYFRGGLEETTIRRVM